MAITFSDKAKKIIAMIAPTLGTALGGPLGGLAGAAIASAVGGGDPKQAEAALLTQDPATLLALRKADNDFQIQLKTLGVEEEKLGFQDVASAREMAKVDMRPQIWIAALFIGGYFGIILSLVQGWVKVDPAALDLVKTLLTMLTIAIPMILQFFFGSSTGAKSMANMLYNSKPADSA
jgi:hypothetical protein